MDDLILLITIIGSLVIFACFAWMFASLGKRMNLEEKRSGKGITYTTNPFAGTSKHTYKN
ncbi:hypothetical protein JCM9140_1172 [Halalkalibacter wakoensis JCM 9140]|uniref:Uncharacterized protein n=1 Tax=Halalkalibacter wakoensis JCM 9140 TaxID=1236970 RepID=W4PZM6_9BACI|nr:hypothetical protein [Halalkalibacter wakoensis]GAE25192.1 hypothetical protein JCM9140_1172 [Halalkalibacter wakoensis JCM 9140]